MTESQREYHRNYSKKYYQEHKEYFKEKHREWIKNNPERSKELNKKSRNKRAEQLIEQGVVNPWSVINYGYKPKYKEQL